jgi:hypothetical protein
MKKTAKKTLPTDRDEVLRRTAAEQLAQQLARGDELVARCAELSAAGEAGDQIGSLNAAARLILANARIAQALAQVARVERRSRSVTERVLPPRLIELNSKTPKERRAEASATILRALAAHRAEERLRPESPHQDAYYRLVEEEGDEGLDWWNNDLRWS